MLKTSPEPVAALTSTSIDDSKVVSSSGKNNRKSAKSDFTKPVRRIEKPSFQTSNTKQTFTQLRQAFTKTPILRYFDPGRHI